MRTLDKWMAFIRNDLSDEEMEAIAMSDAAINTAWDRIEAFMRDAGQRRKYELREKYEHDYVSDMEGSWKRGRLEADSDEFPSCRNAGCNGGADGRTAGGSHSQDGGGAWDSTFIEMILK